jgi:hypothetical protein
MRGRMSISENLPVETDSFFYRLFKELPQTVFELIGQPAACQGVSV